MLLYGLWELLKFTRRFKCNLNSKQYNPKLVCHIQNKNVEVL